MLYSLYDLLAKYQIFYKNVKWKIKCISIKTYSPNNGCVNIFQLANTKTLIQMKCKL